MSEPSRLDSLDLIRGIAVCGIAAVNILDFAHTDGWILFPTSLGAPERFTAHLMSVFMSGKFLTLFSILFGIGILLQTEKYAATDLPEARAYLPRLGWLWLFGLLHGYLLWHGDVLVCYAVTGMLVFLCREWSARTMALVGWGVQLVFLAGVGSILLGLYLFDATPDFSNASNEGTFFDLDRLSGPYLSSQLPLRAATTLITHLVGIPILVPFCGSLMLIGMSLYKSGFFSSEGLAKHYNKLIIILGVLSLGCAGFGAIMISIAGDSLDDYGKYSGLIIITIPFTAVFYALLISWWSKSEGFEWLRLALQSVGRMAFSNYIAQSIIFGLIFYGHGLALQNHLSFSEVMWIVPLVWVGQLVVSTYWLRWFSQGPLEFIWRKLAGIGVKK